MGAELAAGKRAGSGRTSKASLSSLHTGNRAAEQAPNVQHVQREHTAGARTSSDALHSALTGVVGQAALRKNESWQAVDLMIKGKGCMRVYRLGAEPQSEVA